MKTSVDGRYSGMLSHVLAISTVFRARVDIKITYLLLLKWTKLRLFKITLIVNYGH